MQPVNLGVDSYFWWILSFDWVYLSQAMFAEKIPVFEENPNLDHNNSSF